MDDMSIKEWLNHGVAITILAVFVLVMWRVVSWVKPWAEKIISSHLTLIETMKAQAPKQTRALEELTKINRAIQEEQRALVDLERGCAESTRESAAETKKQTVELEKQTKSMYEQSTLLVEHRHNLEVILADKLAGRDRPPSKKPEGGP